MIKEKFPPILEVMSTFEIKAGLRELSEGILKYEGDEVEFQDRLMFISASRPLFSSFPTIKRYGSKHTMQAKPTFSELKYKMAVTEDIKGFVKEREKKEARRVSFSKVQKWLKFKQDNRYISSNGSVFILTHSCWSSGVDNGRILLVKGLIRKWKRKKTVSINKVWMFEREKNNTTDMDGVLVL